MSCNKCKERSIVHSPLSQDKLSWGVQLYTIIKIVCKRNRELNKIKHLSLRVGNLLFAVKIKNTIDKVKNVMGAHKH